MLARYTAAAEAALACGLGINAGHDLNRHNLTDFLRAVPGVPRRFPQKSNRATAIKYAQSQPGSCALDHCVPANLWQVTAAFAPKIASVCKASQAVPTQNLP